MKALKLNFNLGRRRTMGLPPRPMMHTMASRRYVKSLARGGRIQRQVVINVITLFVATFASTYLYKKSNLSSVLFAEYRQTLQGFPYSFGLYKCAPHRRLRSTHH